MKALVFVGTYTRLAPHLKTANGKGIYSYSLDLETGELVYLSEMQHIVNPSFFALDPQHRFLYAVSEVWGWPEGLLSAYRINQETGALTFLNKQSSLGALPVYSVVEKTGRYALLANYGDGVAAAMYPINTDGSLKPANSTVQQTGAARVVPGRQEHSHPHSIVIDAGNRYAYVSDLGLDKIYIYSLDLDSGQLVPNNPPSISMTSGSGPRHLAFHPSGKTAYVIHELDSTISTLAVDSASGRLDIVQTMSSLPARCTEQSYAADVHVHPSGKFLYASNRGHDSIAIFAIEAYGGTLSYLGCQPSKGKIPRSFVIDPTGSFLLVANQDSDNIATFRINQHSGLLANTGHGAHVPTPACLKMFLL